MINFNRAGLAAGVALVSVLLAGCAATELPAYRPTTGPFCHWEPGKDGDQQVCPGGLQTAPYFTGDAAYAALVARYGPPVLQPGESGAALCRRVRLEYRDTGGDITDFHCAFDHVVYKDPDLSPRDTPPSAIEPS